MSRKWMEPFILFFLISFLSPFSLFTLLPSFFFISYSLHFRKKWETKEKAHFSSSPSLTFQKMKGISHYFFFTFSCLFLLEKAREKRTKEGKKTALLSPYHPLSSLVQKEFENEHDHFPSYFSRLTPFFRNGNGRENLFFLLSFFLLLEWAREEKNRVRFPLLSIFLPY